MIVAKFWLRGTTKENFAEALELCRDSSCFKDPLGNLCFLHRVHRASSRELAIGGSYPLSPDGQSVRHVKQERMFSFEMTQPTSRLLEVVVHSLAPSVVDERAERIVDARLRALLEEIRLLYGDAYSESLPGVMVDEQADPKTDSGAVAEPQIVVTEPLPLDTGVEAFKEWLIEYQVCEHPSTEPSVWYTREGDRARLWYRTSDCWICFETITVAPGKLTITKMTCSRHWKDYFEELIGAIRRQWSSTQYYTCFMSYSSKDQAFAERLRDDLQGAGVRCWFAPEDMKIGDRIRPTIEQSIRSYDKLLIVLSEHSIDSDWVEKEVETAFEEERKRKTTILFPIRLDSAVMDTDPAWAADIRRTRHIGDFTNWKDHDAYQKAFDRLLRDLKAEDVTQADM